MSTVTPWLDDAEIDWRSTQATPAIHIRRSPQPVRWRRAAAWLGVSAVAAAAVFGLAGRDDTGAVATAPPLRVPASVQPAAPSATTLEAIGHCESRGDPTAVSSDGLYRGKYQFDLATWRSVGGSGDPALAPESEQDRRARALAAERGTAPWPVCGAAVGGH